MEHRFIIENKTIALDLSILDADHFVVKSSPYSYAVRFIDEPTLQQSFTDFKQANKDKHFLFVDRQVNQIYREQFWPAERVVEIEAIESNKTVDSAFTLVDELNQINFTKKEKLISVGGGITQDVSAFARAVFKRGINWTFVPTTLLSMADSCIGAKSAINYGTTKNLIGLFSAPKEVFIYTQLLKSLAKKDVLSGYGEILKLCIVGGQSTLDRFDLLTKNQQGDFLMNIDSLIKLALLVKKSVIELDEFEFDIRRALNYGHTIGHAIEPLAKFNIPHGIAVLIGMIVENEIACVFGDLSDDENQYMNKLIMRFIDADSCAILASLRIEDILANILKDKKTENNTLNFAIPMHIGNFGILKIDKSDKLNAVITKSLAQIITHKY